MPVSDAARSSLNLSTYIALYNYGYRNVYELGPRIDPSRTIIQLDAERPCAAAQALADCRLHDAPV